MNAEYFEFFDTHSRFFARPYPGSEPFKTPFRIARNTLFQIQYLLRCAHVGDDLYEAAASQPDYLEPVCFISHSQMKDVLQYLLQVHHEPVRLVTVYASTWHEAPTALFHEMIRESLVAGDPSLVDCLSHDKWSVDLLNNLSTSFDYKAASKRVLTYNEFNFEKAYSSLEIEAANAFRIWCNECSDAKKNDEPDGLNSKQKLVFEFIVENPGRFGKEIAAHTRIPESTLTRHVLPQLRRHGLKNRPGDGYFIEKVGE